MINPVSFLLEQYHFVYVLKNAVYGNKVAKLL